MTKSQLYKKAVLLQKRPNLLKIIIDSNLENHFDKKINQKQLPKVIIVKTKQNPVQIAG